MSHVEVPTWVRAGEVKRTARLIGLDRLQQYIDHLTGMRAYSWFETRMLTAAEWDQLAAIVGEENLDLRRLPTELAQMKVEPPRGYSIDEHLSSKDLVALVSAKPFVRWYNEERRRLQRDAQLLADQARLREGIAEIALKRAQDAYIAAEKYTSNKRVPDRWGMQEEARERLARHFATEQLFSRAAASRRAARWASYKAAQARSAADRLGEVKSRDLVLLGAALESFICREFTCVLASIDSVAMLFTAWVDAKSISCANPKCSQEFLQTNVRRRRSQQYCSPACKTAAYRTREGSAQLA
jgi:hypothetical protein